MSKRTTFTTISPLPAGVSREAALDFLHNHLEMIDLNPLIRERHIISPPAHAAPEEHSCVWYSLTDEISYLPGGLATGNVTYTCAFHDLPNGLQTHCYAPMGLDIRDKWTVAGSLPGEPVEPVELGLGAPLTGLYLREDVDMRCNVFTTSFVKKTLKKSHGMLVDRIKSRMQQSGSPQQHPNQPVSGPVQVHSTQHSRQASQSSLSSQNSQRSATGSALLPLQIHKTSSYNTLGNQVNLLYRPPCSNLNKPLPEGPPSAYPKPLHTRRPSRGTPVHKHSPSWTDIKSQSGGINYADLNVSQYDVKPPPPPPQSASLATYAGRHSGDAQRHTGHQQTRPFLAELE
ncbi:hypothetical protein CPLU01_00234 [Colletotrichum plurivorum]|uniref:DUF7053 domain-containing protein n=1 Tax=Colletotrichum plurivorum TaxID=2175906 RepID=A0A8H6U6J6_9PEZI|nr:hypothetical protein CPLU01_00234 [Colletotrichum plurivorum]